MDLSNIQPITREVPLPHPGTGDPTGLVFKLMSTQDPLASSVLRAFKDAVSAKEQAHDFGRIVLIGAMVKGWEWKGEATWNGGKPPCTPINVYSVVSQPWVLDFLDRELGKTAAFFTE